MTATAISFGIAARISLWVHMGIMIGLGVLAFTGYIFLRTGSKQNLKFDSEMDCGSQNNIIGLKSFFRKRDGIRENSSLVVRG